VALVKERLRAPAGVTLLACWCSAAVLASSQRPVLEARFIGNMAFTITDGRVTVMTDFPYQSGYSGYKTYDPAEIRSTTPSTLVLITHRHPDHWDRAHFLTTD
jgi:L-ascorbate metabolism protein UlaG (beta-lactamase superfamily)